MSSKAHHSEAPLPHYNAFGPLLRFWRNANKLSQAELADRVGTASRHISFLETGRSQPTREMVDRISEALGFATREKDLLSIAAGFMPDSEIINLQDLNDPANQHLNQSIKLLLTQHNPYPAVVVNTLGDVMAFNPGWLHLTNYLASSGPLPLHTNIFDMFFSERGLKDIILNWEDFSCMVLMKIQEQQLLTGNERLKELREWLQAYPGIPADWISRSRTVEPGSNYRMDICVKDQNGNSLDIPCRAVITGLGPQHMSPMSQLYMHAFFPLTQEGKHFCETLSQNTKADHPLLCAS